MIEGTSDTSADRFDDHQPPYARVLSLFGVMAVVVFALDLLTKHLAVTRLEDQPPVRVLGGAIYLLLTRNSGASFSIATDYTYVFSVVSILVVGGIFWVVRGVRSLPWAVSLGLILGGTAGNLTDRLFRSPGPFLGHVVDFISLVDAQGQGFPVFNIADSALCTGVTLAVLLELSGRRRDGTRTHIRAEPAGSHHDADMSDSPPDGA